MNTAMAAQAETGSSAATARAITVAVVAMGGEGGGVLADWIVDVAEHAGYCAQTTSVPGVAQRTGATIYYLEIFPEAAARDAGKDPVLALMPVPGELDVVLASELMEAGRAVQRGLVTADRTTLIASINRVYSMTEKTAVADGQVDAGKLQQACAAAAKRFIGRDFAKLAEEQSSAISAVLLGALAETAALPFAREQFEEAISRSGVGVEASLAAFAAGAATVAAPMVEQPPAVARARKVGPRLQALGEKVESNFPPACHDVLFAGIERLVDFQDERYAAEYLALLESVRDIDVRYGAGAFALLRETARYLALWMSYEDAARVADLKIRRTRFERVREETRASETQVVQIKEFLYPRLEELADMMPARIGRWLLRSPLARRMVQRMTKHGVVLHTSSLSGFAKMYMISGLRRWRRGSLRFQEEQQRIGQWLETVSSIAQEDYAAALEIAELPRVVKGYGDTHINGRKKFDRIVAAIADVCSRPGAADHLRQMREAALADEEGQKLAEILSSLKQHGEMR